MKRMANLDEERNATLKDLELRFNKWLNKHKEERRERVAGQTSAKEITKENYQKLLDENVDTHMFDDGSSTVSLSSCETDKIRDQDSAYFSEDEVDVDHVSMYISASDEKPKRQNSSLSSLTDNLSRLNSRVFERESTSKKKEESIKCTELTDTHIKHSILKADLFEDIDIGDPLQESRQIYKEDIFGSYVANELMGLPDPESRLAKIEILKVLNKYAMARYQINLSSNKLSSNKTDLSQNIKFPTYVRENTFLMNHIVTNELSLDQFATPHNEHSVRRKQASLLADAFRRYDYEDIRNMPQSTTRPCSWSNL